MSQTETFDTWAILEQLGHRRTAGRVTEEQRFGAVMGRIDIPRPDGSFVTHYFGSASVYGLTPTTEANARAVAAHNQPEPVHPYELSPPRQYREPSRLPPQPDSTSCDPDPDEEDDSADMEL